MISLSEKMNPYVAKEYENLPKGRYVSIFLLRTTQSETIFRTEGSGEGCSRELVTGLDDNPVFRAVISKRKQTAVERREGRKILRKVSLLFAAAGEVTDETVCALNRNRACGKCVDCYVYGCAVGQSGSQKSRVVTDDAFSLLPFEAITDKKTFNAPYEDGTMWDKERKKSSEAINQDEYIIPGAHFLDIEVLRDVTTEEFIYVLGNILRAKRYGAITSRIGSVSNNILGVIGSDSELFSTLEWVNATAKSLKEIDHPQPAQKVTSAAQGALEELLPNLCGNSYRLADKELDELVGAVRNIYSDENKLKDMLEKLTKSYPVNAGESS